MAIRLFPKASRQPAISGKLHRTCRICPYAIDHLHQQEEANAMRYMCLVHFDLGVMQNATLEARQDIDRRSLAYDEELKRGGHYVASQALEEPQNAILVRVRGGKMSTTDGPYMETKEMMAGFILIEARDMNEAVRLAAGIPLAEIGTIEVRPVFNIPIPPPAP
jgi:hypothetical protein